MIIPSSIRPFLYSLIDSTVYFNERRTAKRFSCSYRIKGDFKRIYHYHIRKTAGTSLNYAFFHFLGASMKGIDRLFAKKRNRRIILDNKVLVRFNAYLINQGHYYYAHSHKPEHQLNLPEDTFTITILRDPLKRLISHYQMLVQLIERQGLKNKTVQQEKNWLGNSFSDFIARVPKKHLMRQLYMFSERFDVHEAYDRICRCSHYFFSEQYTDGLEELNQKLGISLEVFHRRKSDYKKIDISDDEKEFALKKLRYEYELIDMLKKK